MEVTSRVHTDDGAYETNSIHGIQNFGIRSEEQCLLFGTDPSTPTLVIPGTLCVGEQS